MDDERYALLKKMLDSCPKSNDLDFITVPLAKMGIMPCDEDFDENGFPLPGVDGVMDLIENLK